MPNLAKANLLARKTRSVITVLGIALAVSLIMVMVGMVNGTVKDVANRILNIGADIMVGSRDIGIFYPATTRNGRYVETIAEIDGVEKVTPVLIESAPSLNSSKQFNYIYGIDYDEYVGLGKGFVYVEGRKFEAPNELIIDTDVADINDLNINDTVNLLNQDWKIVGIVRQALGARYYVDRQNLAELTHPGQNPNIATVFYVKATEGMSTEALSESISTELGEEDWSVQNVRDLFESILGGAVGLREFMIAVIGVAAIICFAVIMLSMYNAIIERTREIGILKSLGATKRFIISEILKEAAIIVVIGIISGYILTYLAQLLLVELFPMLRVEFSFDWMINSAIIAILATLLGTVYPAWRASRLDPVEALSWE